MHVCVCFYLSGVLPLRSGSSALAMSLQRESNVRFALERKNAELEKMNDQLRREIDVSVLQAEVMD